MNTMKRKTPPILIDEREVRTLLGRLPRTLVNRVLFDPAGRKLYSRSEAMLYV
jgi:hypothetical protein